VDPISCREAFASFITQESETLDELARLLEREHELLVANDVASLEEAIEERQVCMGKLVRIEDERRSMCRMLGRTPDVAGMEQLMAWCDPQGSLKPRWAECSERARRCRELNDRNGALVTARLKRVETLLHAITGKPVESPTYGPDGAASSTPRSGRVLAVEA
jgi:flagellar biosynthesis/type III secretory pathway chaperone